MKQDEDVNRMKRSIRVAVPLLASAALSLMAVGCRQREAQRCVDETNRVVDQKLCQAGGAQPVRNASGGFYMPYRYYYGGMGGYALGSVLSGGSTTPLAGHSYSTSSPRGTSRGGFGSSFSGESSSGGGHSASGGE